VRLDAAFTSDFSRAIDTAALILEGRRLSVAVDPDLRELHYGEWEQLRERDVARTRQWKDEFARMRAEDPAWRPPGGETIAEVQARTFAALRRIAESHRGRTVFIVTHGSAINCMLAAVLGMAPEFTFRISVANCALNELRYSRGRFSVEVINDTSHLTGAGAHA
jgi:broad specificity phosphatase PhoE